MLVIFTYATSCNIMQRYATKRNIMQHYATKRNILHTLNKNPQRTIPQLYPTFIKVPGFTQLSRSTKHAFFLVLGSLGTANEDEGEGRKHQ